MSALQEVLKEENIIEKSDTYGSWSRFDDSDEDDFDFYEPEFLDDGYAPAYVTSGAMPLTSCFVDNPSIESFRRHSKTACSDLCLCNVQPTKLLKVDSPNLSPLKRYLFTKKLATALCKNRAYAFHDYGVFGSIFSQLRISA
jgi:hypothetical protein